MPDVLADERYWRRRPDHEEGAGWKDLGKALWEVASGEYGNSDNIDNQLLQPKNFLEMEEWQYNPDLEDIYPGMTSPNTTPEDAAYRQFRAIKKDQDTSNKVSYDLEDTNVEQGYTGYTLGDLFAASWRNSSIGRDLYIWWKRQHTWERMFGSDYDAVADAKEFLGKIENADYYAGALNRDELMERAYYQIRKQRDEEIISSANGFLGMGVSFAASLCDPVNLVTMLASGGLAASALQTLKAGGLGAKLLSIGIGCGVYGSIESFTEDMAFNNKTIDDYGRDFVSSSLSGMCLAGTLKTTGAATKAVANPIIRKLKPKLAEGIKDFLAPTITRKIDVATGEEIVTTEQGIVKRKLNDWMQAIVKPNLTTRMLNSKDETVNGMGKYLSSSTILTDVSPDMSVPEARIADRLKTNRIRIDTLDAINKRTLELQEAGLSEKEVTQTISSELTEALKGYTSGKDVSRANKLFKGLGDFVKESAELANKYNVKKISQDEGVPTNGNKRVLTLEEIDLPDEEFNKLREGYFTNKKEASIKAEEAEEEIRQEIKIRKKEAEEAKEAMKQAREVRDKAREIAKQAREEAREVIREERGVKAYRKAAREEFRKLKKEYNEDYASIEDFDNLENAERRLKEAETALKEVQERAAKARAAREETRLEAKKIREETQPKFDEAREKTRLKVEAQQKEIPDIAYFLKEMGENLTTAENYVKRGWNKDKLLQDMPYVLKALERSVLINNKNLTSKGARKIANTMFAHMTQLNVEKEPMNVAKNVTWKSRTVALTDEFTLDYMEPMDVINGTLNKLSRLRTEAYLNRTAQQFGYSTYENLLKGYADKHNALMIQALDKTKKISNATVEEARENYKILKDAYDAYMGNFTGKGPLANHSMLRYLIVDTKFWRYATMLGSLVLSSMVDTAVPIFRFGFKAMTGFFAPVFSPRLRNNRTQAFMRSFTDTLGDNIRLLAEGIDTEIDESLTVKSGKAIMGIVHKAGLTDMLEKSARKTTLQCLYDKTIDISLKKNKGLALDKYDALFLKETGLTDAQLKVINDAYKANGSNPLGFKYVDLGQVDADLTNKLGSRLRLMTDQIIQTPTESSIPIWLQDDLGKGIHQFMSWGYLNYTNVVLPMVQGNFRSSYVTQGIAASIILSMFKQYMGNYIAGKDTDPASLDFWVKTLNDTAVAPHFAMLAEKAYDVATAHGSPMDRMFAVSSYLSSLKRVIGSIIDPDRNLDVRGLRNITPLINTWEGKLITNPILEKYGY